MKKLETAKPTNMKLKRFYPLFVIVSAVAIATAGAFTISNNEINENGSEGIKKNEQVNALSLSPCKLANNSTVFSSNWLSEESSLNVNSNPSKHAVTLGYFIAAPSQVMISISNLTGSTLYTLLNEMQYGGFYEQQFNFGTQLAKGIYLLSVEVGGKKEVQKLIIQ